MAAVRIRVNFNPNIDPDEVPPDQDVRITLCNHPLFEFGVNYADFLPDFPDLGLGWMLPVPEFPIPLSCPLD